MESIIKSKGKQTEQNRSMVLKKHVGLIHCENKLSLVQRKICNVLLFNALDQINERETHEIALRQLCSLIGYNSHDSKLIKASVKALISTVMEWNLLEDNKFLSSSASMEDMMTWNASSLLAGASIKNGMIRYSYSPQMRSVLSSLDIYGRINLFVQAKFNSTYSLVLYENCVRFKNIEQTAWFPIELFRSLMGIPEGKYRSFKELRRNVINTAVREINQKSDIYIEPQFKRVDRSIAEVQFTITENINYRPSFKKVSRPSVVPSSLPDETVLLEKLVSIFDLSLEQAQQILKAYEHPYLLEKIHFVQSKKKVDHPGAYLLAALKLDYKLKQKAQSPPTNRAVENAYQREAKKASEIAPLKNKYMSYKLKTYQAFVQQQVPADQAIVKEKFETYLKQKPEVCRFYKKSGLSSPFVMADFIAFIDDYFPDIIGEYLSFDDYLTAEEF